MENREGKSNGDLYSVLGLNSKCTQAELRDVYKNLAMKWHPDRFSASGNSAFAEEAKEKFQSIQRAYSVLSDANKRLLYDVGAYDSDDDEIGMSEFLDEILSMMDHTKPNGDESLEELQELLDEMFQDDFQTLFRSSCLQKGSCSASLYASCGESSIPNHKRSSERSSGDTKPDKPYNSCGKIDQRVGLKVGKETQEGRRKVSNNETLCLKQKVSRHGLNVSGNHSISTW